MTALYWVVPVTALSGFFSLTSYALRAFRRANLEEAFDTGDPRPNGRSATGRERLDKLQHHLTQLRLMASFCRVLANLGLLLAMLKLFDVAGGDHGLGRTIGAAATAAAVIAVFGVAIPHIWASCAGEKILAVTLGPLMACRYVLYPAIVAMQILEVPVRRLAGVSEEEDENGIAKQEILQAASDGRAEGAVKDEEVEMIESVIEFRQTHAGEIMTPRTDILALPAGTDWHAASKQVFSAGHTRVPVYESDLDNIIGILYAKDLLQQIDQDEPAVLRDIMRRAFFVPETKPLDDLLREFKARKVHMAVVLDEYGGTAGLVTIEDVIEEIVGDISDEYDRPEPALMRYIDDKTAEVDGRLHIDELNDAMSLKIPEDEDYETVAGLVFSGLGYIPSVGETYEAHGANFTVMAADERKITSLRVGLLQSPHEQAKQQ